MTIRQKQIWDLLMGERVLTAKAIGQHLHISDRTVRTDIREINAEKGREVILSKKGQGYYMEEQKPFWDMRAEGTLEDEEHLEWEIVRRVLFDGQVSYLELADELYISDTLLTKIVNRVNRRMAGRYAAGTICKRSGFLVLELSEEEIRSYYTVYITTKNLSQFFEPESFSPYFEWVDLLQIRQLLTESPGSWRNRFFDATLMRLVLETGVMAERMVTGHFVVPDTENALETGVMAERPAVGHYVAPDPQQTAGSSSPDPFDQPIWAIMEKLERLLNIQIPPQEYQYFRQIFRNDFYIIQETENDLARGILDQILPSIAMEYGYDLSGDEEFCQEMMAQIMGTLKRNQNRQLKINPILQRLKSQYPLEYDIAIFFSDRFGRLTGCSVGEDEVGFFAIHIIRAMEARMVRSRKKVALVNPFGKPVKELMKKRLEDMGECQITIGESYSVFDLPAYFPRDILAVLTTVPLEQVPDDVPVILCRNFLDYREKEKLLTVLREEEVRSVRTYMKKLFRPSLFFTDAEFGSPREILVFLCGRLKEQGYVKEDFLERVLEREKIGSTVFNAGFAVAHGMENTAVKSAVCVCILKERILWGDCSVKIVFLLALAPNWNENAIPVYEVMVGNLMKAGTIHRLSKIKDCREFADRLL